MSMVDNFEKQLNALRRFIGAHHPGARDQDLESVENSETYFPLEFRKDDVSVTLYIELDSFCSASFLDEAGNRWREAKLVVKPSWPSYGSVDLEQSRRFMQLLFQVNAFARSLLEAFPQPFVKLVETAEQIAERKQKNAEENCRVEVRSLMRANAKGMRVGQERVVRLPEGPSDLLPVGLVTFCDGPRQYTTHVTATRTFCMMRTV